jgi:hypothetical protein
MAKKETGKAKTAGKKKEQCTKEVNTGNVIYSNWQIHPHLIDIGKLKTFGDVIWKRMTTKHEGDVLYYKLWNFWARAGYDVNSQAACFFRDYETANADTDALLKDVGFPWKKAETEEDVWNRIGMVWNWLKSNVQENNAEYSTLSSVASEWPSILDFAKYYKTHKKLVWAACFSKAHLFATLLSRMVYPRYRFAIAVAHHAENGAPPTATHVYVAAYVGERWYYLDPTAIDTVFPNYDNRHSIGVSSFTTVDYEHPYDILPVPLSGFGNVPYLPS